MRRIVLYGPPIAGKTTVLRTLARSRGLELFALNPLEGATHELITGGLPHDGAGRDVVERGFRAHDVETDIEYSTLAGSVWNKNAWPALLARADAIVLVLDPQPMREEANGKAIDVLKRRDGGTTMGCVLWTKQDLVPEVDKRLSARLAGTVAARWPSFRSRQDRPRTLLDPILGLVSALALKLARE